MHRRHDLAERTTELDMLERTDLPSGLQSLTFGHRFNQSSERTALPNGLQSLTFGHEFNQSLERTTVPSGLQSLMFDETFNQSLVNTTLPSGLQSLRRGRYDFRAVYGPTVAVHKQQ